MVYLFQHAPLFERVALPPRAVLAGAGEPLARVFVPPPPFPSPSY